MRVCVRKSVDTSGGLPVRRMPKPPSRSMRAGGRNDEAADHAPGGIMRSAIVSWQKPGARAAHGGGVQQRQTRHRLRRAIAWWAR